jgi:peptidoglycan/xylan/chitin deacetylase (PgdA/CDA1 family)
MRVVSLLFHDVYASDPRESGFRSPAADRYKLSVPDFEAQLDGLAAVDVVTPWIATEFARTREPRIPDPGPRIPAVVTFDDGGESYYTVAAERLEALGWRGHCFVSTNFIGQRGFLTPAQIRELDARGHLIGSHSASHPARFNSLTLAEMRAEWSDSRQKLEDLLGHAVTVGSVPGGYFSADVAKTAAEAGLNVLFTSEPTTTMSPADGLLLIGRFTIRRGHPLYAAQRFVISAPWARCGAWVGWNAKAIVKPVLGGSYARVADWLLAPRLRSEQAPRSAEHHG